MNYFKKIRCLWCCILLVLLTNSCIKNEYSLNDISLHSEFRMGLSVPLIKGEFKLENLLDTMSLSNFQTNGDSISFVFGMPDLFQLTANELVSIPQQESSIFRLNNNRDIPFSDPNTLNDSDFTQETYYPISLSEGMSIDSFYINYGFLNLTFNNTYDNDIDMEVSSESLILKDRTNYIKTIFIAAKETQQLIIDLSTYKLKTFIRSNGETAVKIKFNPTFYKSGTNTIKSEEYMDIEFQLSDLNSFNVIFGNLGNNSFNISNNLKLFNDFPFLNNITGELAATNPQLRINYEQSVGMPIQLKLDIYNYSNGDVSSHIESQNQLINYSKNYLEPNYEGSITYNKSNTKNLDQLLSFPIADSLNFVAQVESNPTDILVPYNYVFDFSQLKINAQLEIPLELKANLHLMDTISNPIIEYENNSSAEIDYLNLHYSFLNSFPLSFNTKIILYDSLINQNIDTILFNSINNQVFIEAAQVTGNNVSSASITEGILSVNNEHINSILQKATHFIICSELLTPKNEAVMIDVNSQLNFKIGLEFLGNYITEFDWTTDEK